MRSTFIASDSVAREKLDWGARAWLTRIGNARAGSLVVIEVDLLPGCGHAFHLHPNQEEIVYSLDGEIEQWIGMEKEILRPGDSTFVEKNTVHASFNVNNRPAKVLAVLGPVVGEEGYKVLEVENESPWNTLRGANS